MKANISRVREMLPLFVPFGFFRLQTGRILLQAYIFIIPFCCLGLLSRLLSESRYLQIVRELNPIATLEFHAQENCERLRHKLDKSNIQNCKRIQLDQKLSLRLVHRGKHIP